MSSKSRRGFLTERQIEVLRLRLRGLTQEKVAEALGTSRENVSVIEKRAREKLRLALETLEIFLELSSTAVVELEEGVGVEEAALSVFRAADEVGVKLKETFTEVVEALRRASASKGASLGRRLRVYVRRDGFVVVRRVPPEELEVLSSFTSASRARRA
ncbi:MAG: Tfx family DNA-binding protein [Fervidicoccaceae archaeon]